MGMGAIGLRHLRSVYRLQGNWALIQDIMIVGNNGPSGQTTACRAVGMALEVIFTGTITLTLDTVPLPVKVHTRAYAKYDDIKRKVSDKMNCTVGSVHCFLKVPLVYLPSCPGYSQPRL